MVSPTPIHGQWLAELQQHSDLKVEVYYGLQWHRSEGTGPTRNRQAGQTEAPRHTDMYDKHSSKLREKGGCRVLLPRGFLVPAA